jgi:hypothetical protein
MIQSSSATAEVPDYPDIVINAYSSHGTFSLESKSSTADTVINVSQHFFRILT